MTKNTLLGVSSFLIGLVYTIGAFKLSNPSESILISPKLLPLIVGFATMLTGAYLTLSDLLAKKRSTGHTFNIPELRLIGLCSVLFLFYSFLFERIGFLLSTIPMLIALLFIFNRKGKSAKTNIFIGIIFPFICYFIFTKFFAISLPRGILPF